MSPISWIREQTMIYLPASLVFLVGTLILMTCMCYATRWMWKEWSLMARVLVWMLLTLAGSTLSASAAWIVYNIDFPFPPTEYAPDYTLQAFRQIEVGMTRDEVYALVGRPLCSVAYDGGDGETLWYSRHRVQSDCEMIIRDGFWFRIVEIDSKTDTVIHVKESYYTSF